MSFLMLDLPWNNLRRHVEMDIYRMMGMQPTEMRLSCSASKWCNCTEGDVPTYDRVVLAAHHVGRAGTPRANADDLDGRAVQAQQDVEVSQDNAEKAKQKPSSNGARL